jgi:branched-subunit amino acid ABC-type transport system permease component
VDTTIQGIIQGLSMGSIYAIAALGFSLIYYVTGTFHIAYGGIFTVGTYVVLACGGASSAVGLIGGLVAGAAVAIVLNVAVDRGVYAPARRRGAAAVELFVASLAINLVLVALLSIVAGPNPREFTFPRIFKQHPIGGVYVSWLVIGSVVIGLITLGLVHLVTNRTSLGRQIGAIAVNPELAQLRGINVAIVSVFVFGLAGVLSVVSSTMFAMTTNATPDSGIALTLLTAIAVLMGGAGSPVGAYAGGMIIGLANALASSYLPGDWQTVIAFAIFILIVLTRPQGIFARAVRA